MIITSFIQTLAKKSMPKASAGGVPEAEACSAGQGQDAPPIARRQRWSVTVQGHGAS